MSASASSGEEFAFESLVGFLRGPVWNIPILTFIENKSLSKYLSLISSKNGWEM